MEKELKLTQDGFNEEMYKDYDLYEKSINKSKSDSKRKTKKFKKTY